MNTLNDRDAVIAAWLDDGPMSLPADTRQAIVVGVRTVTRRSGGIGGQIGRLGLPQVDVRRFFALAGTAAVVVVVAAFSLNFVFNQPGIGGPPAVAISPIPTDATSSPIPSPQPSATAGPATSGGMWPQTSNEEVRQAQELADAGDPAYTWQVDPQLAEDIPHSFEPADSTFLNRFLRDVLGWERSVFLPWVGWDELYSNLVFARCAPGATNALYPEDQIGGRCSPTIDDLRYDTVRLDLGQPGREGPEGIWVVTRWATDAPFSQVDPRAVEDLATATLEEFLDARIAGRGAEPYVDIGGQRVFRTLDRVPLLYGPSTGASYERYELDVVDGPRWPNGDLDFDVRLFADGDAIVVDQPFTWRDSRLFHDVTETKENGQPLALPFAFLDGRVILTAAKPWEGGFERNSLDLGDPIGTSGPAEEAIVLLGDPIPAATGCENGPAPANADALARSLETEPDVQVTAPTTISVGGIDAVVMDVVLAPGASDCEGVVLKHRDDPATRRWVVLDRGSRMRLYLFDAPEGSSMRILAIAVVASEERFESVLDAATPVLDSIEFPTRGGDQ